MTATQGTASRTHRTETAAEVVGRLRATFNTGVTRPLDWRIDQLRRLRALLVENEQELIEALWADLRKSAVEAKTQEIDFTVADIDEMLANLESWLQPRPVEVPAHFGGPATTAYTTYDPLGVVLVIAPWNFPLHLLIDPIIGALAAGNTVVAKPSEVSVHTSAVASRLLREYFDADVLTVVEGGAEETTASWRSASTTSSTPAMAPSAGSSWPRPPITSPPSRSNSGASRRSSWRPTPTWRRPPSGWSAPSSATRASSA